jgi:hypothetical protein
MTSLETQLSRQLQECRDALAAALRENELLRQKVELLIKRIFGSESGIESGMTIDIATHH